MGGPQSDGTHRNHQRRSTCASGLRSRGDVSTAIRPFLGLQDPILYCACRASRRPHVHGDVLWFVDAVPQFDNLYKALDSEIVNRASVVNIDGPCGNLDTNVEGKEPVMWFVA